MSEEVPEDKSGSRQAGSSQPGSTGGAEAVGANSGPAADGTKVPAGPKLIAAVDGSVYSQSVCDHAAWLAQRIQASIELVHVLGRRHGSSEPANLSGSIGLGARTALLEELAELDGQQARLAQRRGRAILDSAKEMLQAAGVPKVATRLRNGQIVDTMAELEADAGLIVIGKRGEGADFDKLHLGSNVERVVRVSHRPIMVTSRAFKPINRFLIAFDGGASVMKAVDYLVRESAFRDIDCHVLSIGEDKTRLRRQQEGAVALLREKGYTVTSETLPGEVEEVIAGKVESEDIDMLVMGAYGHSRIRQYIIGSTTTEMIRSCRIPVVLFR